MIPIFSNHLPKFLLDHPEFDHVTSVDELSFYLYSYEGHLALMTPTIKAEKLRPFYIDFIGPLKYHQKQKYALKKEPLAKAVGGKFKDHPLIWDITCGTGSDSLLLLSFGARVIAFERNNIMWALLQDALDRAQKDLELGHLFKHNFTLIKGDPRDHILDERPEALYYDPMYPGEKRKALPRKEMRIIREIVGDDTDFGEIFKWAKEIPKSRFVIKRALKSPDLKERPGHIYEGKSTRYDVYFR